MTERKKRKKHLRPWAKMALQFIIIFASVFVLTRCLFMPYIVSGQSMVPTLKENTLGVADRVYGDINRFDIVVAKYDVLSDRYVIKRVVGLPNETIAFRNNALYIDGKYVEQSYFNNVDDFTVTLDENSYFLMGDNTAISLDSRIVGPINKKNIIAVSMWYTK